MLIINKLVKKTRAGKTNSRWFFQDAGMPASVMYWLPIPCILSKNAQQSHAAIKGRKNGVKSIKISVILLLVSLTMEVLAYT